MFSARRVGLTTACFAQCPETELSCVTSPLPRPSLYRRSRGDIVLNPSPLAGVKADQHLTIVDLPEPEGRQRHRVAEAGVETRRPSPCAGRSLVAETHTPKLTCITVAGTVVQAAFHRFGHHAPQSSTRLASVAICVCPSSRRKIATTELHGILAGASHSRKNHQQHAPRISLEQLASCPQKDNMRMPFALYLPLKHFVVCACTRGLGKSGPAFASISCCASIGDEPGLRVCLAKCSLLCLDFPLSSPVKPPHHHAEQEPGPSSISPSPNPSTENLPTSDANAVLMKALIKRSLSARTFCSRDSVSPLRRSSNSW